MSNKRNKFILIFLLMIFAINANAKTQSVFEKLARGKTCNASSSQKIDCSYRIGNSLWIEITGVGENDVGITFMKSDYKGEYFAKVGKMHHCVIVTAGLKSSENIDYAFISPKTGKIYKSVNECYSEFEK